MGNTLLNSQVITRETLRLLREKATFIGLINRSYDNRFAVSGAKIGSQLQIRLPNDFSIRTGRKANLQNIEEQTITLNCAKQVGVDFSFYSDELALSVDDFSRRYLEPAAARIAAHLEEDALTMAKDIYNSVGTPGTTPASQTVILQAAEKLGNYLAPDDSRNLLVDYTTQTSMVNALSSLFHDSKAVSQQYLKGAVKNALGFDWYTSSLIPTLTTGSDHTTVTINGANQEGSTLTVAGGNFKKGDIFTIADVYAVHPQTKATRSWLQQFTVTADGTTSITISPSIISSGAKQTVSAVPADSAVVTVAGTASTGYPIMPAFHRDAFAFVTADLEVPKGVDMAHRETLDGLSLRFIRDYDSTEDQWVCRFDVLYDYKTVRPQLACRVWG